MKLDIRDSMGKVIYNYLPENGQRFLKNFKSQQSLFFCTIAHTETSSIPGISAAGASVDLIKYTPVSDIEAIYYGSGKTIDKIPENPLGPPSPVVISIAALKILNIPFFAINAGVIIKPLTPLIEINDIYGESIYNGKALFNLNIDNIFEKTSTLAKEIGKISKFITLGESVPGGTTTAMSMINSLGYNSFNKICGSMPGNQHNLKIEVVKKALSHLLPDDTLRSKILKIADPMQPIQAKLTIELAKMGVQVLLAGGTQMVAVAALIKEIIKDEGLSEDIFKNIAIGTTKWVSLDKHSDIVGLMEHIDLPIPLLSCNLNFSKSKYKNLQMYEDGYVKEGVGAGALALLTLNNDDIEHDYFVEKVEEIYEGIYK